MPTWRKEKTMRNATMEMLVHNKRSLADKVLEAIRFTAHEPYQQTLNVLFAENPDTDQSVIRKMVRTAMFRIANQHDVEITDALRQSGMLHLRADCARKIMEH